MTGRCGYGLTWHLNRGRSNEHVQLACPPLAFASPSRLEYILEAHLAQSSRAALSRWLRPCGAGWRNVSLRSALDPRMRTRPASPPRFVLSGWAAEAGRHPLALHARGELAAAPPEAWHGKSDTPGATTS